MKFRRIFYGYVTRYFAGFFIAFICSILVVAVAGSMIRDDFLQRAEIFNRGGVNGIAESVAQMELVSQITRQDTNFTMLSYEGGSSPVQAASLLYRVGENFSETGLMVDAISYGFVLFQNNDMYLSTQQRSLSFAGYYGEFLEIEFSDDVDASAKAVREYLFGCYKKGKRFVGIRSITYIDDEGRNTLQNAVMYLSDGGYRSSSSLFCFVISEEELVNSILMPEQEEGFLYIEDIRTDRRLFSYGSVSEETEELTEGIQDHTWYIMVNENLELGWKVVTGLPMAVIYRQMIPMFHTFLACLVFGLIAVIGLTLYFSMRRYKGMEQVMEQLLQTNEEAPDSGSMGFNDYRFLTERIVQLKEQGEDYQQQQEELKRQNQMIRLRYLMFGENWTPWMKNEFRKFFDREPEYYCIVRVKFMERESESFETIVLSMISFLKEAGISLLAEVYGGDYDEIFWIAREPEQDASLTDIQKLFSEMVSQMTAQYDEVYHVGISTVGVELSNVHRCVEQTRQLVEAQDARREENVVECYQMVYNIAREHPVNLEFLNRLYALLLCGDQEEILDGLDSLERFYVRLPLLYESSKEQIYYSLSNVFHIACGQLNDTEWKPLPEMEKDLPAGEMFGLFRESAREICAHIAQNKKSNNETLKKKILRYLEENVSDASLTAFRVSQECGISEKYLYQFLKEQTGEPFSVYLLHLRIELAKKYLTETDYSNERIAELTGFVSVNTFYRNFNKLVGTTPKNYRKIVDINQNHSTEEGRK